MGFPGGTGGKELDCQCRRQMKVCPLGQEDPLEEEMATHSCIIAWRIPWTEEPGGLQSIGSQRVGHDLKCLSTHVEGGVIIESPSKAGPTSSD